MNERGKRKLKKLMRDPKQYFLDMKILAPIVRPFFKRSLKPFKVKKSKDVLNIVQNTVTHCEKKVLLDFPDILSPTDYQRDITEVMDKHNVKAIIFFWQVPECLKETLRKNLSEFFLVYVNEDVSFSTVSGGVKKFLKQHRLDSRRIVFSLFQDNNNDSLTTVTRLASITNVPVKTFAGYGILSAEENIVSYIVDRKSFPFIASSDSELLTLLNNENISALPIMREVPSLLRLMRDLCVNACPDDMINMLQSMSLVANGPHVLVIGDSDLTSAESMARELTIIRVAKEENSRLSILYIPDPSMIDWIKTQESFINSMKENCIPVFNNIFMSNAILHAERVYTRKASSAFFALIHDVPLTVFEDPFYAGWGLTDDRLSCENRHRSLTLEELFCGFFLLYQHYEKNSENLAETFIIHLLKFSGFSYNFTLKRIFSSSYCTKRSAVVGQSILWPLLLSPKFFPTLLKKNAKGLASLFPIKRLLESKTSTDTQLVVCFLFAGLLRNTPSWQNFINILASSLPANQQIEIFRIWYSICSSDIVLQKLALAYESQGNSNLARSLLRESLDEKKCDFEISGYTYFLPKNYNHALQLLAFEVRQRNLDVAYKILLSLLFSGCRTKEVFYYLTIISKYRFNFDTAELAAYILYLVFPAWKQDSVLALHTESAISQNRISQALQILACGMERDIAVPNFTYLQKKIANTYGNYNWHYIAANLHTHNCSLLNKAKNYLLSGQLEQAHISLYEIAPNHHEIASYFSTFIQFFILSKSFEEAENFLNHMVDKVEASLFYSESIKLALTRKNYTAAKELYSKSIALKIQIQDPIKYRMQYLLEDFHGALETIYTMTENKTYLATMAPHYISSLKEINPDNTHSLMILVESGPGDEVREASHYLQILEQAEVERVVFTCDERLYKLFARSFPDLNFHPFPRFRHHSYINEYSQFSKIPSSEFVWMMNNDVWDAVQLSDKVIRYFAARVDIVKSYDDIAGTPFLKADAGVVSSLRSQLTSNCSKPLVGLCWRSSLQTEIRNDAFLSLDELIPIFDLDCVQFVNCQSDGCTEKEKIFFEKYYPNMLLEIHDIDQYNDFDSAASLYSALDFMVSCPNTVMELAGALGVPTLTFTLTYEPDLHLKPGCNYNVYYNCVEHVGYDIPIDQRDELVQKLRSKIQIKADQCMEK